MVTLTPREAQMVQSYADGYTTREIAEEFGITFNTARTHRQNIKSKLGYRTVAHMIAECFRHGWIH